MSRKPNYYIMHGVMARLAHEGRFEEPRGVHTLPVIVLTSIVNEAFLDRSSSSSISLYAERVSRRTASYLVSR